MRMWSKDNIVAIVDGMKNGIWNKGKHIKANILSIYLTKVDLAVGVVEGNEITTRAKGSGCAKGEDSWNGGVQCKPTGQMLGLHLDCDL